MLSKEGFGIIFVLAGFVALFFYLGYHQRNNPMLVLGAITLVLFAFSIYFFRDPLRVPPDDPRAIVSPADGKIVEVDRVEEPEFIEGEATRIAIFLSLFDVHVNYVPYEGTVEYLKYRRGKFLPAYRDEASEENVQTIIGLQTRHGKLVFKQMVGIMARRIVCRLRYGDHVRTGQKFGIIKFGSRMEVYLPAWATVNVKVGDRVKAAESVIAYVNEE